MNRSSAERTKRQKKWTSRVGLKVSRLTGRLLTCQSASRIAAQAAPPDWARQLRFTRKLFQTCIASCTGFSALAMSWLWNSPSKVHTRDHCRHLWESFLQLANGWTYRAVTFSVL